MSEAYEKFATIYKILLEYDSRKYLFNYLKIIPHDKRLIKVLFINSIYRFQMSYTVFLYAKSMKKF